MAEIVSLLSIVQACGTSSLSQMARAFVEPHLRSLLCALALPPFLITYKVISEKFPMAEIAI